MKDNINFEQLGTIRAYNADCKQVMKQYPDKYFDLAIVDPEYGGNDAIGLKDSKGHLTKRKNYKVFKNIAPDKEYFKELDRISKKWIVWGGNFFGLTGGVIVWNKHGTAFGEAEIAICNTHKSVRIFDYVWNGMLQQNMKNKQERIHPTEKPIDLYKWCLQKYAKAGDKILDTFGGSMSHAIACHDLGFELVIVEKDTDYYSDAIKRLKYHQRQLTLF